MKIAQFFLVMCSVYFAAQSLDTKKAPNSYIYDTEVAATQHYNGIKIPVEKAYEMWKSSGFLKVQNASQEIPTGTLSASVYWEDVPGLISEVSIEPAAVARNSKIKVLVNNGKGKGNAVVAFKVNNVIYWSWHIWVTDTPQNGVTYQHGFENNVDDQAIAIQYMDRNLGAVSNHFLGDEWQKSTGLMYEWGRKDPFPPLVHKDAYFYELSGEVGNLKHPSISPANTIPVVQRPSNDIGENMRYAAKNPIHYIINSDNTGNWFSNQRYKVAGTDFTSWDLWADNAKGANSNANSSNFALKKESRTYELKSELDPCPNGWRVPSYYGRVTQNNNLSFFGRRANWNNDDTTVLSKILPTGSNATLDGVKVYPGLGMDFTLAEGGARNIGIIPVSGAYVYYPNVNAPTAPVGIIYQDNNANGVLWSATFGYDGARGFSLVSDPARTNTSVGLHAIYNNETFPTRSGNAVRCVKDKNVLKIGDFVTEYFSEGPQNFTDGLDNPNSYIVKNNQPIIIPVNKAFSVYNQVLTNNKTLAVSNLVAKVYWATNQDLVQSVQINGAADVRNSTIAVTTKPGKKGSAVISLHDENTSNPALWSWLIWAPEEDPEPAAISYTTETALPANGNFVNPTKSTLPPLSSQFMNINLGAEKALANTDTDASKSKGLHFQWGRKDALPSFSKNASGGDGIIYIGSENSSANQIYNYTALTEQEYKNSFTTAYQNYESSAAQKYVKVAEHLRYAAAHPLSFLYHTEFGELYNGGTHVNNLNKVKDWVLQERNQASERWGHGTEKSPFDPCPEGWRVPDVSSTQLYSGSKGNSPWYNSYKNDAYGKPGVIQDQWHDVTTFYGATYSSLGYFFNASYYNIGNFPADGIRGELGGRDLSAARSGVWTAALADHDTGYALAMQFQTNKMQTATGVYPQAAMAVRCAKDAPRYLGTPPNTRMVLNVINTLSLGRDAGPKEVFASTENGIFSITNLAAKSYKIYDASGKLVLSGQVTGRIVDASSLISGYYNMSITLDNNKIIYQKIYRK